MKSSLKKSTQYVKDKLNELKTKDPKKLYKHIKYDQFANIDGFEKKLDRIGEAKMNPDRVKQGVAFFWNNPKKSMDRINRQEMTHRLYLMSTTKPDKDGDKKVRACLRNHGDEIILREKVETPEIIHILNGLYGRIGMLDKDYHFLLNEYWNKSKSEERKYVTIIIDGLFIKLANIFRKCLRFSNLKKTLFLFEVLSKETRRLLEEKDG